MKRFKIDLISILVLLVNQLIVTELCNPQNIITHSHIYVRKEKVN